MREGHLPESLWLYGANSANRSDFLPVYGGYAAKLGADGPVAECRFTHGIIDVDGAQRTLLKHCRVFDVEELKAEILGVIGHDFMGWPQSPEIWLTQAAT